MDGNTTRCRQCLLREMLDPEEYERTVLRVRRALSPRLRASAGRHLHALRLSGGDAGDAAGHAWPAAGWQMVTGFHARRDGAYIEMAYTKNMNLEKITTQQEV